MHIEKTPQGRYRAHVRWTVGERVRKRSATFDRKKEAEAWAHKTQAKAISNHGGKRMVDVIQEYRSEWLEPQLADANTKTAKATHRKRMLMLQHIEIRLDGYKLAGFNAEEAHRYKNMRLKSVSADSVRKELSMISAIFIWLQQEKLMTNVVNPIRQIKMPPPGAQRKIVHKKKEQELLRQELGGEYAIVYDLLLETAMRLAELMYIRVEWVDLDEEVAVNLPAEATKTGEERFVPLSPYAVELFTQLTSGRQRGHLFTVTYEAMRSRFRRAKKRTGLTHLRLHDCRHTAATKYAKTLPNMLMVQQVTGHRSMQSLKRYVHYTSSDIRKHMV